MKCEWCGEKFDINEAEVFFSEEMFGLEYENIRKCLCGSCAIQAIEDEVDGIYFERCEVCGREFDLIEESAQFSNYVDGTELRDYWPNGVVKCCDCAMRELED